MGHTENDSHTDFADNADFDGKERNLEELAKMIFIPEEGHILDVTLFWLTAVKGMGMKVLQLGVLLRGEEVGTGLGDVGQLAVAENLGVGVIRLQGLQQGLHGVLLGLGAGVGRMAVGEQTALVADAD